MSCIAILGFVDSTDISLRCPDDLLTKVPEDMQLNVTKKQREMVLLEESLHAMRSRFNARFLSLRSIKREILATVAADNRRLREIDAELGGGGDGACPTILDCR